MLPWDTLGIVYLSFSPSPALPCPPPGREETVISQGISSRGAPGWLQLPRSTQPLHFGPCASLCTL